MNIPSAPVSTLGIFIISILCLNCNSELEDNYTHFIDEDPKLTQEVTCPVELEKWWSWNTDSGVWGTKPMIFCSVVFVGVGQANTCG